MKFFDEIIIWKLLFCGKLTNIFDHDFYYIFSSTSIQIASKSSDMVIIGIISVVVLFCCSAIMVGFCMFCKKSTRTSTQRVQNTNHKEASKTLERPKTPKTQDTATTSADFESDYVLPRSHAVTVDPDAPINYVNIVIQNKPKVASVAKPLYENVKILTRAKKSQEPSSPVYENMNPPHLCAGWNEASSNSEPISESDYENVWTNSNKLRFDYAEIQFEKK